MSRLFIVPSATALSLLASLLFSLPVRGEVALTAKVGTLGAGLELTVPVSPSINLRLGGNKFDYAATRMISNVNYDGKLSLSSGTVLLDFHPGRASFRFTAGGVLNANKIDLNAKPTGSTYTINDTAYTAAEVGTLTGRADFTKFSPYAGIGSGNALSKDGRWHIAFDLGVVFQGAPKLRYGATGPAAATPKFQSDLSAERQKAQNDVSAFRYYPVLSLGVSYRF